MHSVASYADVKIPEEATARVPALLTEEATVRVEVFTAVTMKNGVI
jgi:hypothetical protein